MHHAGRLTLLAFALLALSVGVPSAGAEPPGARLAVMTHGFGGSGIVVVGPGGEQRATLVPEFGGEHSDAHYPNGDRPAWSPDGTKIAFSGSFGDYSPVIFAARPGAARPSCSPKAPFRNRSSPPTGSRSRSPSCAWSEANFTAQRRMTKTNTG